MRHCSVSGQEKLAAQFFFSVKLLDFVKRMLLVGFFWMLQQLAGKLW